MLGIVHYRLAEMKVGAALTGRLIRVDTEGHPAQVATLVVATG